MSVENIIGQEKIVEWINNLTLENCPHFIIFQGPRRCGKTFITNALADKLKAMKSEFGHYTDDVKHIISTIYNIKEPCVYWCEDLDKMKPAASNSLLKVTEETPGNAYIILHSVGTPIPTLVSRAQVINFEPYFLEDYKKYCEINNLQLPENYNILFQSCNSLAEVEYQIQTGKFSETYELACKVLDYIGEVSVPNAFKITQKLALKKDAEGLDPIFFLTVLLNCYIDRKGQVDFGDIIVQETQQALSQLNNPIFSPAGIMDRWVMKIMKGIDERC